MSEPRIAPGGRREIGVAALAFSKLAGRVMGTTPPNIFLTLSRTRSLFWGWLIFAGRLMPGGTLKRREAELVILRVAGTRGSEYELVQHRLMGRRVGLSADQVERAEQRVNDGFSGLDLVLLETTDRLLDNSDLSDEEWAQLRRHTSERNDEGRVSDPGGTVASQGRSHAALRRRASRQGPASE